MAMVANMVGDPARALMLSALLAGRQLTAGDLAEHAGVTPQTASSHLSKLLQAGLVALRQQGRQRYFSLSSPLVAHMLESILAVAEDARRTTARPWRGGGALRDARTCYDHIAGRLGVGIADGLIARNHVALHEDGGEITSEGITHLAAAGLLGLEPLPRGRRPLCRPCLDWSERRPHLAGRLGAAIAQHAFGQGWIRRVDGTRAVAVTDAGRRGFHEVFGLSMAIESSTVGAPSTG